MDEEQSMLTITNHCIHVFFNIMLIVNIDNNIIDIVGTRLRNGREGEREDHDDQH